MVKKKQKKQNKYTYHQTNSVKIVAEICVSHQQTNLKQSQAGDRQLDR